MPDPQEILDALSTAVVVLDGRLRFLSANSSAQTFFGLSTQQLQIHSFGDVLQGAQSLAELLQRGLENGEACTQREATLLPVHGGGIERVADVYAAPLDLGAGARGLLVEITDVTQRQRIDREASLLAQLGGSRLMVRQLAHEIKNPLGGLRGAAQLLDRQLKDGGTREYTKVIIGEADRLAALVDAMLGPSRPLNTEAVNIHELCEHVRRLLSGEAPAGVAVERDYDPSLPELSLDRHMIIQAMLNLGRNALQAVETSGRVTMRTRVMSHQNIGTVRHRLVASIQFEDSGPGVPEAIRDTLFYPLVTGRETGSGLGLAIAQDLVTRHGGLIEFTSLPTRFTILLPVGT